MVDFEENVEEMVGTTREAADGDRVRRGRDGEFDEDEMAALEGQRLVAEFRCGIY